MQQNSPQKLIAGSIVVTMDQQRRIIVDGGVLVNGNRIAEVGNAADLASRNPHADVIDAKGCLISPGFIDAHNHPAHFLSKGLLDDVEIGKRWAKLLYPFDTGIDGEHCYWGSVGTFAEMLLNGTTCFNDPGGFHPAETVRAATDIGIRGIVTRSVSDLHDPNRPTPDRLLGTPDDIIGSLKRLHDDYHGSADGRIRIWLGLRSSIATSDQICRKVADEADRLGVGIHAHLAVTPNETAQSLAKWGKRPVARFGDLGLLRPNLLAVHMGAIEQQEVDILARQGVRVIHCPSASMFGSFGCIAHGLFPEMVAAGMTIGLGSDAASISRFLDLVRVMYLAACAHKDARYDAEVMGAHKAFEMATIDGARALMWNDEIGSLEPGKLADITLVEMSSLEWQPRPLFNPVANLVYSSGGHAVRSVMVDGRWVVRDRQLLTMDDKTIREGTSRAAADVVAKIRLPAEQRWPVAKTAAECALAK
jgi:5-methylthioadenosine/S-adenosylhomocysteine deaminase